MAELSIDKLRELFDYDPLTGILTRRPRPRSDFPNEQKWKAWRTRCEGKPTGWRQKQHLQVFVLINGAQRKIAAHRIAWALVHGRWPTHQIDHRDGNGLNNRLVNLREATQGENNQNQSRPTLGTVARRGRFQARIHINRRLCDPRGGPHRLPCRESETSHFPAYST